MQAFNVLKR